MLYQKFIKVAALLTTSALLFSCASCGQNTPKESTKHSSQEIGLAIANGLEGSCTGDNEYLPEGRVSTENNKVYVYVRDPMIYGMNILYSVMITNEDGESTQIGFKKLGNADEYSRFVFDFKSTRQFNYAGDYGDDFSGSSLAANIPSDHVVAGDDLKFNIVLNVFGKDVASCPADGSQAPLVTKNK